MNRALPRAFRSRLGAVVGVLAMGLSLTSPMITAPIAAAAPSVPDAVADPATALKLAHQANKQIQVTSKTTEASETVANPDGSWTMTAHAQPVRMQQNGNWVSLDPTLAQGADGTIIPKALPLDVALNAGGTRSAGRPVVRVGIGDKQAGLTWPTDLPVPSLNGATATYAEVFPGVDLKVTVTTRGYTEDLVVKTAAAAASSALATVQFGLFTQNTSVSVDAGRMEVKDNTGKLLFVGDASSMWDSSGVGTDAEKELGTGGGNKRSTMTVSITASTMTATPDHAFLTDPATKFPVMLDSDCTTCATQAHEVVQSGPHTALNYNRSDGDLSDLKAGYETRDNAGISRSYFQVDTSQIAGSQINSATVNTTLLHSDSCTPQPTGLYMSGPIDPSTNWDNKPGLISLVSTANDANCHDAPGVSMQFQAQPTAQLIADRAYTSTTFALVGTEAMNSAGLASWRRFGLDPVLQVKYDKRPDVPSELATQSTLPCVQGSGRPWVSTTTPELDALASDPDGGNLTETFGLDAGTASKIVPNTRNEADVTVGSGTVGQLRAPAGWVTGDGNYSWNARADDGELQSDWSSRCEFTVDSTPPPSPAVTMTGTPPSTQGDPATFTVSVGLATAGLYDIDHFIYTTDGSEPDTQTSPSVPATQNADKSGATASLTVTALNSLQNYIHVRAVNRAGTPSLHDATCVASLTLDAPSCSYNVPNALNPSTALVGAWGFDEGGGRLISDAVATTPGNAAVPVHNATLIGGGDWRPGHDHGAPWSHPDANGYAAGTAGSLTFDGTSGYVQTGAPVVDTSQSFSASAWVYLTQTGDYRTAVSVGDKNGSSFYLQYAKDVGDWSFTVSSDNSSAPHYFRALSRDQAQLNTWTHLLGTYDASTGAIKLYVNGVSQTSAVGKAWRSTGTLTIGAADGGNHDFFPGQIDSPEVWQRVLSDQEAHDLANTAALLAQYNLGEACGPDLNSKTSKVVSRAAYWPLDEGSGATAKDVGQYGDKATLTGGYSWTDGPTSGGKAVHFDGTSGSAGTQYSVVDTSRSFTVSAWAKVDDLKGYYAVAAQHGTKQDAFQIRYSPDVNRWIFGMTTADDATTDNYQWAQSSPVSQPGQWTLVTGVFDRNAMRIRLYLNGKLQDQHELSAVWQATGSLFIGSLAGVNAYFKGSISQVQMWNQALTDGEVASLDSLNYYDTMSHTQGTASGGISLIDDADGCSAQIDTSNTGIVQGVRPPSLRTDRSYSVEAWVKHGWTQGGVDPYARSAVSTSDSPYVPFSLGYRPVNDANGTPHGKWSLLVGATANHGGAWIQVSDQDVTDNTWTHIEAVYDATRNTATLYVNGVKQNTSVPIGVSTTVVTGWNGSGGVILGQDHWGGNVADPWYGGLAGVRLYSGALTTTEIQSDKLTDDPGLLYGIEH